MQFGGWNANPMPAGHIAAFRYFAKTYGAVPLVMTSDYIEMLVLRPPKSEEAAMAVALEQFIYSPDIVWQGTGSVEDLARELAGSHLWYFWWD